MFFYSVSLHSDSVVTMGAQAVSCHFQPPNMPEQMLKLANDNAFYILRDRMKKT